jgi:hypothetical protein
MKTHQEPLVIMAESRVTMVRDIVSRVMQVPSQDPPQHIEIFTSGDYSYLLMLLVFELEIALQVETPTNGFNNAAEAMAQLQHLIQHHHGGITIDIAEKELLTVNRRYRTFHTVGPTLLFVEQ